MNGPEHYREAERLIRRIPTFQGKPDGNYNADVIALAQTHATLALAAATAAGSMPWLNAIDVLAPWEPIVGAAAGDAP